MAVASDQDKKFVSLNYSQRVGLVPTTIAIIGGWVFAASLFVTGLFLLPYKLVEGLLVLLSFALTASYMWVLTRRLTIQSHLRYELLITPLEVILYTYDTVSKVQSAESVFISQVKGAEYFSARDVASLILKTSGHTLEIPLWAFGKDEQQIRAALQKSGIHYSDVTRTATDTRF